MKMDLTRLIVAAVIGLSLAMPAAARAEDDADHDHDLARDLYEQGAIRSLSDILHAVDAQAPGKVVAVALVKRDGRWVYRLQIVTPHGRRRFVEVDADAAKLIGSGDNDH
jgi:uncharacterized membrane protein YkoI